MKTKHINNILLNNHYSYDFVGNIKSFENTAGATSNKMAEDFSYTYTYDKLNRLKTANGNFSGYSGAPAPTFGDLSANYTLAMEYDNLHNITHKIQQHYKNNILFNENSYKNQYNYSQDKPHQLESIQDGSITDYFGYDPNGNLHRHTSADEDWAYFWDEANRLRSAVINGIKMMHYIYDASGERTLKAQTEYQGVFENGTPTDEGSTLTVYTTYPSPYLTVSPDKKFTNHYYAGSQRIASKPAGNADRFNVLQIGDTPDLEELRAKQLADAQFVADSMELGQLNLAQPGSGIIIIPAVFYFHPDHLGSSTLITDNFGDPYQFFLNLPFGETFAEQRRSGSFNNPYKFNGKELDEETGLYYYGARYYNPRTSVWLSVDPIALWQPVQEVEHYIEGQHNGGYFNPQNMNVYGYTYQNPVRYVDPNGKQVDAVLKSQEEIDEFTKNGTQKAKWDNVKNLQNAFQVNGHGNSKYMLNYIDGKGVGKIDGPISFNKRFEDNEKWQSNKNRKGFKLILHSCNVGNGENSLAARISKYYENISVIAPTRYLWGTDSQFTGVYDKGNKDLKNPGYWIIYQRGIAVGAYDATWYPGASTKEHKVDLKDIPSSHYDGEIGEKDYSKYKFKKDDK